MKIFGLEQHYIKFAIRHEKIHSILQIGEIVGFAIKNAVQSDVYCTVHQCDS